MGEMLTIWAKYRTDLLQIIQAYHSSEYFIGNKQIADSYLSKKMDVSYALSWSLWNTSE